MRKKGFLFLLIFLAVLCTVPMHVLAQSAEDSVKTAHDSVMKYLLRKANGVSDTTKPNPAEIKNNDTLKVAKDKAKRPQLKEPSASDFTLEIISLQDKNIVSKIPYQKTFTSKAARDKELQGFKLICFDNAYLTATYDSIGRNPQMIHCFAT